MPEPHDNRIAGVIGGLGLAAVMFTIVFWFARSLSAGGGNGRTSFIFVVGLLVSSGMGLLGLGVAFASIVQKRKRSPGE
jgi:hypothetical protein